MEERFRDLVETPAALALSSCTGAMHVALAAMGVGPGDRVVTTPMTFASTVHVIEQVGATPVLVDVDRETLNIDASRIDATVGDRAVRAMLPVHYGGHPCDLDSIYGWAIGHGCAVIEDAAHALSSFYRDRPIGAPAQGVAEHAACFSFYVTKNMTTAEGGMLVGSEELIREARLWSLHGMTHDATSRYGEEGEWYYEVVRPGFKYNLSDVHAAIGLKQMDKLSAMQRRRREIAVAYNQEFASDRHLEVPTERPEVKHSWHLYPIRLHLDSLKIDRAAFIRELRHRRIGTSVHFIPVHLHPYYRDRYGYAPEDFPVAFAEYQRLISLPIHPRMTEEDVQDVVEAVTDIARLHAR
jgi:dTDP-4-amino-4,6-dideoxygalactose transaminase